LHSSRWGRVGGGGGGKKKLGWGKRVGIFKKFLMKGCGGYPFFGQGERRKDVKWCLLTPFCTCRALKHSKIAQTTLLGLVLALFTYFWRFSQFLPFFGHFFCFLLNKASDERVGGGPSFLDKRGVAPPPSMPTHFNYGRDPPTHCTTPLKCFTPL
jgi:hypothetical protein